MNIMRITTFSAFIFAIIFILAGCAKYPSTPATTGKQLVLTLKVRGTINPVDQTDPGIRRYYFIAIDNDGDPNTGPWAVIYPPYGGNGWVTSGNAAKSIGVTSYIQYDETNPGGYIYNILPGSFFLNTSSPQPPISYELLDGGSTIRFTIDFSQIATDAIPAEQIEQLDINFITTNVLAVDPNNVYSGRQWDALGDTGKDYVTIDARADNIYYDDDYDSHSVTDPDLDIVYWSVEVQTVSSR